jgi:radical SAM superfamily enzyme YgiQ (UPF0313 family)
MNILLIQPPVEDFYNTPIRTFPLGLAYIAGALRESGYRVSILDCHTPQTKMPIPVPHDFADVKTFYPYHDMSPFRLFSTYYHFGLPWETVHDRIKKAAPDIVGISANFTPYFDEALRVARITKAIDPRIVTILGGAHVNSMPLHALARDEIDYVVYGEGEKRFVRLVAALREGRREGFGEGIGYKKNGESIFSETCDVDDDLDVLAWPAFELLDMSQYMIKDERYAMLLTSRGCPQQCSFCSTHLTMGSRFRSRSPQHIVDEMLYLYKEYGVRIFDIEDDNFTYDRHRLVAFLTLVQRTFSNSDIKLKAMNGLSLRNLDAETLALLVKSGMSELNIALVSHEQKNITALARPHTFEEFQTVIKEARLRGMFITAYIILGLPDDSCQTMCESISVLVDQPVLIGPSIFYPTPGTKIYTDLERKGLVNGERYRSYRSSLASFATERFSKTDLMTLMKLTRMFNFLKACADRYGGENPFLLSEWLSKNMPDGKCTSSDEGAHTIVFDRALSQEEIGVLVLSQVLQKNRFYLVERSKTNNRYAYLLVPQPFSTILIEKMISVVRDTILCGPSGGELILDW